MSGGQQQRVALARALVIKPALLLLDEPLSNLDAKLREEMQVELRQIQRTVGTTTILVTHDQREAMALSDRIVRDEPGPRRADRRGRPRSIARPATAFVASFLGKTNVSAGDVVDGATARLSIERISVQLPRGMPRGAAALRGAARSASRLPPHSAVWLRARVTARVFQGTHWLLQRRHARPALLMVIAPNDGARRARRGRDRAPRLDAPRTCAVSAEAAP